MSTAVTPQSVSDISPAAVTREVRVYSHSMIFYWWPVWAVGYLLALLTYIDHNQVQINATKIDVTQLEGQQAKPDTPPVTSVYVHRNQSVGVIFTFTFLLVILMTHFAARGVASLTVIVGGIAVVLFIAYMGWWDEILHTLGDLAIFMNLGFYMFFSTVLFLVWAFAVFVAVRFDYYIFRPGQLVHVSVFGGGEESFDTRGMSVLKMRDDLFRHWILGLGSGDLHVATTGARKADFVVHNVLFIGNKLEKIQQLVAQKPDDTPDKVFTAGAPA